MKRGLIYLTALVFGGLNFCGDGGNGETDGTEEQDIPVDDVAPNDQEDAFDAVEDAVEDETPQDVIGEAEAPEDAAEETGELPLEQMLILDVEYTHNTETMAFSFFEIPSHVPDDWTSPVNYAEGTLHQRLEVITKPSDKPVDYQLCFFQDEHTSDNHACASYINPGFIEPGVYTREQEMVDLWQYGVIEWNRSLLDLMLVVKDGGGNPVDTRYGFDGLWDGSPDLSLYYPMEVHFTAVIVPPGGTFTGWP